MTLVLGLDPSLTVVGYCLMDGHKRLIKVGQYKVKKDLSLSRKLEAISDEIISLAKNHKATDLAIEDIFYSKNPRNLIDWARLHGALMMAWAKQMKGKPEPKFIMANKARPYAGIKGTAQKIEVQIKIGKDYKLVSDNIFYTYCGKIGNLIQQCQNNIKECQKTMKDKKLLKQQIKKIRSKHKYQMTKLSREFEKDTEISEHLADSVVIANAYLEMKMGAR